MNTERTTVASGLWRSSWSTPPRRVREHVPASGQVVVALLSREERVEARVDVGGQDLGHVAPRAVLATGLSLSTDVVASPKRARTRYERYVKPVMDRVAGLILALVAIPVILVVALAIRIKLGKGVIYKQCRVGRAGTEFTMYKFRTMTADRRKAVQPYVGEDRRICHKRVDDPRHTPLGRFLRCSSLDELPQLWNVIRGEMSLVGPRPELPHIVEMYEPWQHERHQVKPGITGFWQLSGRAGGLAYEGVELDIDYLRKLSFATDLGVLLRTVPVAIIRTGR